MRKLNCFIIIGVFTSIFWLDAFGGQWIQESERPAVVNGLSNWLWENDDGSYAQGWSWIDGNKDGLAEYYYFSTSSDVPYMAADTIILGKYVNADGAWTTDGKVNQIPVPVTAEDAVPYLKEDYLKYLDLIGLSKDAVEDIYGVDNVKVLAEFDSSSELAIESEGISIEISDGKITGIEMPWTYIIGNLPVTCNYFEFEDIIEKLGFKWGENLGVFYYEYGEHTYWVTKRPFQYSVDMKAFVS